MAERVLITLHFNEDGTVARATSERTQGRLARLWARLCKIVRGDG